MKKNLHGNIINLAVFKRNEQPRINCYVRGIELILTPEEEVRQALLAFIYEHSEIDTSSIITRVEYQNFDIVFYKKMLIDDFQPSMSPLIIIETKRDGINLLEHERQIKRYLNITNCKTGFLFNLQSIYLISDKNFYQPIKVDINDFLKQLKLTHESFNKECLLFENAANGDFNCFKALAIMYGNNSKIAFITKESPAPIVGFLFEFISDYILFDICGVKANAKKQKLFKNSFLKLKYIKE